MVVSIVITLAGALALLGIPVTQYPAITPPSVQVSTSYSGASAEVVANSLLAAPSHSTVRIRRLASQLKGASWPDRLTKPSPVTIWHHSVRLFFSSS